MGSRSWKGSAQKRRKKGKSWDAAKGGFWLPEEICMMRCPFDHPNKNITDALKVVSDHAELQEDWDEQFRSLAFQKAAASIKALPRPVTVENLNQIKRLPNIGKHTFEIIKEVVENGFSSEAEEIKKSQFFKSMVAFTNVYGVGPRIAWRWYDSGLRTIDDVIKNAEAAKIKDIRIKVGLVFYDDLQKVITIDEAERFMKILRQSIKEVSRGEESVEAVLAGGFRRGKPHGHDLDILITHKDDVKEEEYLAQIMRNLQAKGLILLDGLDQVGESGGISNPPLPTKQTFGRFYAVVRMPHKNLNDIKDEKLDINDITIDRLLKYKNSADKKGRKWTATRVDLIAIRWSEYAYAIVGWTGNGLYNRSLRDYAKKKLNMKLTSHNLTKLDSGKDIPAQTEEDVFKKLKLEYIEPEYRNP